MRASRPPAPPPPPPPGASLGPLTLLERIAVGGIAEVFLAREPRSAGEPRTVVVKRMLPHVAAEHGASRMFESEARIGRLVAHPNVVGVLGLGEADGQPYLCLEHVPGLDLGRFRRWMAESSTQLPVELALYVIDELLAALAAVHTACDEVGRPLGLVHGDVSPSNLLLSIHGEVKLADFGVAQARFKSSYPQAATRSARGKLAYLAPEHVRGEPHDHRADVFAAGAVLGELVADTPVFARESDLSTLLAVRDARLDVLYAAPRMPEALLPILQRALAADPDDRFDGAATFRLALESLLGDPAPQRARLAQLVERATIELAEAASLPQDDGPTMEPPLTHHQVRTRGGEAHGPWSFAQLVEAVTLGRLEPTDEVRVGSDPRWQPIAELETLAAYLPNARLRRAAAPDGRVEMGGGGFVDALARSVAAQANGVWRCHRGQARKEVFLIEGRPEFVTSNVPQELLGELLVSRGVLSRGELEMALAVLPRFEGRLGDTLAALGLLDPVDLIRYISEQVREKLLDLFAWDEGHASFVEGVGPPARGFPLGLDAWRILLDGIGRRFELGIENDSFDPAGALVATKRPRPPGLPHEVQLVVQLVARPRALRVVLQGLADPQGRDTYRAHCAARLALALDLVRWV